MLEIKNWFSFDKISDLVKIGWDDFWAIEWGQVKYSDINLAVLAGLIIFGLVSLKLLLFILFGRKKYTWADSGHLIYDESQSKKGILPRIITVLPSMILVVPLVLALVAVAEPFLITSGEEKKYITARTITYLRDVSGSMGSNIPDTAMTKAELAMNAHLKFLEMRRGKGDRTSFWLFSDSGFLINDYVVDDKLQYLLAYDAPWGFGSPPSSIPDSRLANLGGEGGTLLNTVLMSVINQFDRDEELQKKNPGYQPGRGRSVIIYSDSDIFDLNRTQERIDELVRRRIKVYVIITDDRRENQVSDYPYESNPFLLYVQNSGGKFFLGYDLNSMIQANIEIDRLEKVNIAVKKNIFKIPLFDRLIFASILILILIFPAGLSVEVIFREYP
ncbi:MAG: hypothetical protein A3B91_04145 [Candidatus Yanofskybacteria bacterium RIFCSPHIGHO2_02_FULL_41_29]|uniref:VWFA domain-containing protein n=1 Tax=Candidatus Yanofskybacteria bacterium RIFCSPHIGHO2_01_FULL_41_53 TaxID=1802663 RepID=A0A1F8EF58_9BACT|nr:MAG: hypothetical protein A2650_02860 [Candidatus Yanofskybacteria bacterium RIFCSPHIGHO2_01_FULL_41_53]OGN10492.1 MAG: hypothetical protein A3B91_04145 [Candidatus Yanofskybacteria bacterium RIFCSPHIGHO2_02_FULL_41_29]OGN21539.1 MAG: hypothetical protein A2916_04625 [Candidatus Yanofskybacteria bacterium RIFCSPLOWO2_01_FULL_41_67]OGN29679.1 MAG: hypothetical protein A3H54_02845 [Candidatus Yanofskybacteria bacterium RIFCSPLOWO2_02_FULL_41_13]